MLGTIRAIDKPPPIPEVVFNEVLRYIEAEQLEPGDRLPSENELAEHFGVGRSSIREAMQALQLLGVIEIIQGKGTFVKKTHVLPLMVDWSRIAEIGIICEVMEARQFIEVLLAQLAAERATAEDVAQLTEALDHSRESVDNVEHTAEAGVNFHLALAEAAHNQVLTLMYRTIHDLYLETARQTRFTSEIARDRVCDHERIFEAICDRDPEAAANAMQDHIEKAGVFLTQSVDQHSIEEV